MKKTIIVITALVVLTIALAVVAHAQTTYPQPTGFVNDYAHVFSPAFIQKEDKKLSDYQKKTSNEIAIVTISSLGDQTIEDYSIGLANQWKPGVKGKDNGVIMLFSMQDHKMRIEVGRGLQGNLTDIQSNNILSDMIPYFKSSQYEQGVDKGVNEVIANANGAGNANTSQTASQGDAGGFFTAALIFLAILALVAFFAYKARGIDDDSGDEPSSDDSDTSSGGDDSFLTGALAGGVAGYAASKSERDDSDDDSDSSSSSSSSSSDDDDSSSSSGGGDSFGGFGGGAMDGGGASASW